MIVSWLSALARVQPDTQTPVASVRGTVGPTAYPDPVSDMARYIAREVAASGEPARDEALAQRAAAFAAKDTPDSPFRPTSLG